MNTSESAPALSDPTTFGLESGAKNTERLLEIRKKKSVLVGRIGLGTGEKLSLLKIGDKEGIIYAEYDSHIVLYIQYHEYQYPFLPVSSVTQTKLWRSKDLPVTNAFSQSLFFRLMLGLTGAMLSDKEHTPDGVEFWKRRAREAAARNLHVGVVDFGARTCTEFKNRKELEAMLTESWGGGMDKTRFQQVRWLIWR